MSTEGFDVRGRDGKPGKSTRWRAGAGAGMAAVILAGVVATLLAAPGATGGTLAAQDPDLPADSFPHADHQGLFPLCQGCHDGIEEEDEVTAWPEPESCNGCHDGVEQDRVAWEPPTPASDFIAYSHAEHVREVAGEGEPAVACASCHVDPAGPSMSVIPLEAERCLDCHGDAPGSHFEPEQSCGECHQAVGVADDGEVRLDGMDRPDGHEGRTFLLEEHGAEVLADGGLNRCATCHVEDQCASCHVDAGLEPIPQVPRAPAQWHVPLPAAEYPEPDSHDDGDFSRSHGRPAPASVDCSTCHTQDDCASCHLAPLPPAADTLEERPRVRAPGVGLEEQLPASHDTPFFLSTHPLQAATGPDGCASCHTQAWCAECHDAPMSPGYHPPSFALRHSAPAQSQPQECSNCHNTAAFCRECHTGLGMESSGRLGQGWHDAEPVWLLRHGVAARQGMEQCASCHQQRDCLQCHSQLGAFQVSPHGPGFDPERARARNPFICRACHIGGAGIGIVGGLDG